MRAAALAGFAVEEGSIFTAFNHGFSSYDLRRAIGPLSGASFIRPDLMFSTTGGALHLRAAGEPTFSAAIGAAPVPETATLRLFGTGAAMVGRSARKRFRRLKTGRTA